MFANHVLENVPNHRLLLLDHLLGLLDSCAVPLRFELVVDERLKKLERHFLRKPALVEFQFRADNDHRTAGVVYALSEKVLAEPALLAFQGVAQRLERPVIGAAQHSASPAVVKERVHRFLQHALFVSNDYVWRAQLHELLQPVIADDDAPVEIVQVRRRKTAAIQWHKRAQLRRKNRNHVENHPLRFVAALAEGFQHFQALGVLDALLQRWIGLHLLPKFFRELVHFDAAQKFLHGFRAHLRRELAGIFFLQFAVFVFEQDFALAKHGNFAGIHDDERFKVENALQVAHGNIQQVADAAGQTLEEPHVRARRSQFDVAEALAADLAQGDFHAALVANHAAMLHALVFSAQAFPVRDGAKYLGAEKTVPFRLERAVVDGLRLGNFSVGPRTDFFRARQTDSNRIEIGDQTGAIIRAAAIQGCFLSPQLPPGTRSGVLHRTG